MVREPRVRHALVGLRVLLPQIPEDLALPALLPEGLDGLAEVEAGGEDDEVEVDLAGGRLDAGGVDPHDLLRVELDVRTVETLHFLGTGERFRDHKFI